MSSGITIEAEERDLLYHRIMIHLSGIDAVWLAAHHEDFAAADRLGRQFSDELQLVLDDLGWGDTRGDDPVQLTSAPDVMRRVFELLRDLAGSEGGDRKTRAGIIRHIEEENRAVRELCERLLAGLAPRMDSPDHA